MKPTPAVHYKYNKSDKGRGRSGRWKKTDKGLISERLMFYRRRALHYGGVTDLTRDDLIDVLRKFDTRCAYCEEPIQKFNFDHVLPLINRAPNVPANIVPCCVPCNRKKRNSNILVMRADEINPALIRRYDRVIEHIHTARRWDALVSLLLELNQEVTAEVPF